MVTLVFGLRNSPEELALQIRKEGFSLVDYRGKKEKTKIEACSPLVKPSFLSYPLGACFALATKGGSIIYLGVQERLLTEGSVLKFALVVQEVIP